MIAAAFFALALGQAQADAPSGGATTPVAADTDIPKGAPSDDYGLVAWCRGALTGHMALFPLVKPELRSIERKGEVAADDRDDREQMQAGRDYLELYRRAMTQAEKSSPAIRERGATVEAQGEGIWTAARAAAPRERMWTWLMWDLPGRCETAAKRLETRSGLLGEAFKDPGAETAPTTAPPDDAAPSDAPAADAAPADAAPAAVPAPTAPAAPQ